MKYYLKKYKELVLYVFFGGLTTLINIVVFFVCREMFSMSIGMGNIIAWVISVLFAFVTNKKWVFESNSSNKFREMLSFYLARIITLIAETILLYFLINIILLNEAMSKIISNILVIIFNYLLSKLFVFKKNIS